MSIKLKGSSDGSVSFDAPADTSPSGSDVSFTLPIADGSAGQVLATNGSGALSFANEGKILQVVQNHVTTTSSQSVSQNTTTNITNLSASITPKSSTSDMLVFVMWHGETNESPHNTLFGLRRDTAAIGNAASSGNRSTGIANIQMGYFDDDNNSTIDSAKYQFFDTGRSSGTSQITYHATVRNNRTGGITLVNNRTIGDLNSSGYERCTSSITILEVAA